MRMRYEMNFANNILVRKLGHFKSFLQICNVNEATLWLRRHLCRFSAERA